MTHEGHLDAEISSATTVAYATQLKWLITVSLLSCIRSLYFGEDRGLNLTATPQLTLLGESHN